MHKQIISIRTIDLIKWKGGLLLGLCVLTSPHVYAQLFGLPHQERYTISSGLSNNSITDIQQDLQGNLWIGTADGLNVYNGYTFSSYHPDQSDSSSISDSFISSLEQDADGQLWIATQKGGLNYYNDTLENFSPFSISDEFRGQTDFFVTHGQSLFLGDSNYIWMGSDQGTVRIARTAPAQAMTYLNPDLISYAFLPDRQGGLWIASSGGLLSGNTRDAQVVPVAGLPVERSGEVIALAYDASGNVLVGAKEGLFIQREGQWVEVWEDASSQKSFQNINALLLDRQNRMWVGGQTGLKVLDGNTMRYDPTQNKVLSQNKLNQENIHCFFLDREDNLWIGTANNGLIRLFLSSKHFPVFRKKLEPNDGGAPENTIRSIWADSDGQIWLGTYGAGLFRFDRASLTYTQYAKHTRGGGLSGNQVSEVYRDRQGTLWVGTWGDGLNRVERRGDQLRFLPQKLYEAEDRAKTNLSKIHQILEDEYGNLWVGTNGGFFKKRPTDQTFTNVTARFGISDPSINVILEDGLGNWWVGTWNGLFLFDAHQMKAIKQAEDTLVHQATAAYFFEKDNPDGLSNNRITSLYEDRKGRVWVGTYGGGLNLWEPQKGVKGHFRTFSDKNGLPNNVVFGIMEDSLGKLWLSTNNGLVLFDPEVLSFKTYNEDDGLQSNQFYFGAYAKTPAGEMIFGGTNGVNIFDPLLFSQEIEVPHTVYLTDFFIRGEKIKPGQEQNGEIPLTASLSSTPELVLQSVDNSFRIDFISPGLNYSQKVKYAYRMVGLTDQWQYTSSPNRSAVYSNLFEGTYEFEVRASLDGQHWSETTSLVLKVLPPWYRTWWAKLIFGVLFLLFLGTIAWLSFVYSNLRNKLALEKLSRQQEAEINRMRLWFFTYISHEFRTPLMLIISPLTEILNNLTLGTDLKQKLSLTYKNSQRLLRLVNQILNFRLITSGKLKLYVSEQDIVFFVHEIFSSFTSLAKEKWIDYQFSSNKHRIPLYFDAEKMELILYNLISNAFKYSPDGGQIIIKLEEQADRVIISVKDRGVGIPASELTHIFEPFARAVDATPNGSGIGLAVAKDLTELHQGTLSVASVEGKGSMFELAFLTGSAHFEQDDIQPGPPTMTLNPIPQGLTAEVVGAPSTVSIFPDMSEGEKLNMLIVEDNPEMRRYLADHFAPYFHLYEASNGKEGLAYAHKKDIDIIISDVMMPELDGVSMVTQLKSDPKTRHIPVVLLSSRTTMSQQLDGLDKGAFDYLTKPVNIHVLQAKVKSIIDNIQVMRERYKHETILPTDDKAKKGDEKFLLEAAQVIEDNLTNAGFNAGEFAEQMGISRSGLYKKLQKQTGKSTTEFIRYVRIKHAEKLLREGQLNISQAAFKVGFNDLKYFRKCFKDEFGLSPSKYLEQERLR